MLQMKECLIRIAFTLPQMPAKIFFLKDIPTLMASRYILLPKKGPQVACDMIPCLRVSLQLIKEMPKEHVSNGMWGKREVEDGWQRSQFKNNSKNNRA